jgi:hypothetical protein
LKGSDFNLREKISCPASRSNERPRHIKQNVEIIITVPS